MLASILLGLVAASPSALDLEGKSQESTELSAARDIQAPVQGTVQAPVLASTEAKPGERVMGGQKSKSCHWPSALLFFGIKPNGKPQPCSASLVHPQIVVTAAHCLGRLKSFRVATGDGSSMADKESLTWHEAEYCKKQPGWNGNHNGGKGKDFAYCKLAEPIKNVPPTPILMGCERDALQNNTDVTVVGFGLVAPNKVDYIYTKREVVTKFLGYSKFDEANVGVAGKGPLAGDSGGPAYVKLPEDKFGKDAGWRVFGITSQSRTAPGEGTYGQIHRFVEFVEKDSKIDITPCFDADGTWNPGPECKGAPLEPHKASGTWVKGCEHAPAGGYIASCGKPYKESMPLAVTFKSPKDKQSFEADEKIEVEVELSEDKNIAHVLLLVNDKEQKKDDKAPYEWSLKDLDAGKHRLVAVAVDEKDKKTKSEAITIEVEEDKESGADSTSGEDKSTSSKSGDGTKSDAKGSDGGKDSSSTGPGTSNGTGKGTGKGGTSSDNSDEDEDSSDDDKADKSKKVIKRSCSLNSAPAHPFWALIGLVAFIRSRRRAAGSTAS